MQGFFDGLIDKSKEEEENASSSDQDLGIKEELLKLKNIIYRPYDNRFMGRKMINGKQIIVYGKTAKEAKENLRLMIKGISVPNKAPAAITFNELWDKWYREDKEPYLKEGSLKDLVSLKNLLEPILKMNLKNLSKEKLKDFLVTLPENRSREKVYIYLRACFKWGLENDVIKVDPFKGIKSPMRKNNHKPPFKYEEQIKILENLKGSRLYPVIIVYLCTGMRKLEFDFKNIEEHIDREQLVLKAENLKGRGKNNVRYKNIQISRELCNFIFEHLNEIHSYNSDSAYREFAEFLKKLNIKGSIVTCRHTYATNNFYLGNPELFISRQMGHASSQITKDNYTDIDLHLSKEKILKLYNNLYLIF